MKQLMLQCSNGHFHAINVRELYSVVINSKELLILEYEDITTNSPNNWTILKKEGENLVRQLLDKEADYLFLYEKIKKANKKKWNTQSLPNNIHLCHTNKEKEVEKHASTLHGNQSKIVFTSSEDIYSSSNRKVNNVRYNNNEVKSFEKIIVYEDISTNKENHPYYITRDVAANIMLHTDKFYYHLTEDEFKVLRRFSIVDIVQKELAILPQPKIPNEKVEKNLHNSETTTQLSKEEISIFESLFEGLVDFKDYYSFFGMEDLKKAPAEEVLNSPRMKELTELFSKGVKCGYELAINFEEFLNGFKEELTCKQKVK